MRYKYIQVVICCLLLTSCATISPVEQSRINSDLKGECHTLYGSNVKNPKTGYWDYVGWTGHNRVFAIGNYDDKQACGFAHGGVLSPPAFQ